MGRRSCGSRSPPRSPARRRCAAAARAPTSRSSRSRGAARAAAPARRARARAARRRSRTRPTPCRRSRPRAAGWSCSRRRRRPPRTRPPVSTPSSSVSTETPSQSVSSFDHLVTQWMSRRDRLARQRLELVPRPAPRLVDLALDREAPALQRRCGVGPAESTGKSRRQYWPGGTRPSCSGSACAGGTRAIRTTCRPPLAGAYEIAAAPYTSGDGRAHLVDQCVRRELRPHGVWPEGRRRGWLANAMIRGNALSGTVTAGSRRSAGDLAQRLRDRDAVGQRMRGQVSRPRRTACRGSSAISSVAATLFRLCARRLAGVCVLWSGFQVAMRVPRSSLRCGYVPSPHRG